MWAYDDRRWLRVDIGFLILSSLLLAYNLLAWHEVFGLGPQWHPLQSTALSACLTLQALAAIARRRSRALFYVLVAISLVALSFSFVGR